MASKPPYFEILEEMMTTLHLVNTASPNFTPEPITDQEAAALFRATVNLFRYWGVTDDLEWNTGEPVPRWAFRCSVSNRLNWTNNVSFNVTIVANCIPCNIT